MVGGIVLEPHQDIIRFIQMDSIMKFRITVKPFYISIRSFHYMLGIQVLCLSYPILCLNFEWGYIVPIEVFF